MYAIKTSTKYVLTLIILLAITCTPAQAKLHSTTLIGSGTGAEYVALGDSFAANPSTTEHYEILNPNEFCRYGDISYPEALARYFNSFANFTCSGAVIRDDYIGRPVKATMMTLLNNAAPSRALGPDTQIVTITIGGNESWNGVRDYGLAGSTPLVTTDNYIIRIKESISRIKELAPQARILLVGYPEVVGPDNQGCLISSDRFGFPIHLSIPVVGAYDYVRALNHAMQEAAPLLGVEYVDVYTDSIGHGLCAPENQRYIKAIVDTPARDPMLPLHPTELGTEFQARKVAEYLNLQ
ncbi:MULTISPECIES: SGNH/GDSL hydrolase family protein [unclassified Corynebacterium]|uniref:SGNH/GDSL hydrolase family protein n=1 Tax=unclassified Corynebacterium TaxID=2624378 RepID=UPI0021671ACC|nr:MULTISPECIES: SGNH/GDSL hydrolase family protein [unclassified Corynebacterium]MCS4489024.1 SGNH/GDSL hydrolase family protein [Corynebacterium sp. ES2775-CONJ]MCS4531280.1 SGNH/GDSL hydrolase family protein [Corynebacterium sp. ES2730-CONJ]